jgi:PIN domain nuclease of toxin-antitoxin system
VTTHLLDTNVWIRLILAPDELSERTRALLSRSDITPLALSAISVFEVTLKVRKGKIDLRLPAEQWLDLALNRNLVTVIPIDAEIARSANSLPEPFHQDPADRLIVATARLRNLTLVTSDEKILQYAHLQSFDTR